MKIVGLVNTQGELVTKVIATWNILERKESLLCLWDIPSNTFDIEEPRVAF